MNKKKVVLSAVLMTMLLVMGGAVSAQPGSRIRDRIGHEVVTVIREATGLRPIEIVQQVRDGATLAEVIEANDADVDTVMQEVVTLFTDAINEQVESGNITQERADQLLENLDLQVATIINDEEETRTRNLPVQLRQAIHEATDLTQREIFQQMQDGATLGEILIDNGVDVDIFTADLLATYEMHLSELVTEEHITQEQADKRLDNLGQRLETILSRTRS